MAATKGKSGGFYVGSTLVTFITGWSLNPTQQTAETTAYGDDWETHVGTMRNWSASADFILDRGDAQQAALLDQLEDGTQAAQVVRLAVDRGSDYWEGSVIVRGSGITNDLKGLVSGSFDLLGTGEMTWTEA